MTTTIFSVPNISCMHCVHTIKTELSELPGIKSVDGWADKKQVQVEYEAPATEEIIRTTLAEINFPAE